MSPQLHRFGVDSGADNGKIISQKHAIPATLVRLPDTARLRGSLHKKAIGGKECPR
jgi:hypothetical protein